MVASRALGAIDRGEGILEQWAEDAKLLKRRQAALAKVRQQLVGPQPERKRLRPPKRRVTDLNVGDLYAYRTGGVYVALRVATADQTVMATGPSFVCLTTKLSSPRPTPARHPGPPSQLRRRATGRGNAVARGHLQPADGQGSPTDGFGGAA